MLLPTISLFSSHKEEEKISLLKDRLNFEISSIEEKKKSIVKLQEQIHRLETTRIKKTVDEWDKKIQSYASLPPSFQKEGHSLFLKERKTLTEILKDDPNNVCANTLLDRILRLITCLNRTEDKK